MTGNRIFQTEVVVPAGETYYVGRDCHVGPTSFWIDSELAKCYEEAPSPLEGKKCFPRYCAKGPIPVESYTNQYCIPASSEVVADVPVLEGCKGPKVIDFDVLCGGCMQVGYDAPPSVAAEDAPITDGTAGDSNPSERLIDARSCGGSAVEKVYMLNMTAAPMYVNVSYWS